MGGGGGGVTGLDGAGENEVSSATTTNLGVSGLELILNNCSRKLKLIPFFNIQISIVHDDL